MSPTARYLLTTFLVVLMFTFSSLSVAEEENKEPSQSEASQDSGEYLSYVPDLVGMDLEKVRKTLPDYLLKLGKVTEIPSKNPKNTIITQSVPAFSDVKQQTVVNVTVSSGSLSLDNLKVDAPTELPEPTEKEANEATAIPLPPPSSEPIAETPIPTPEPIITEKIEKKEESSTFLSFVPDLTGMTQEQAKTLLPQHNLILGEVSERLSDDQTGTIIAQSEKANTDIPQNSIIHITVAANNKESTPEKTEEQTSDNEPNSAATITEIADVPTDIQTTETSQTTDLPIETKQTDDNELTLDSTVPSSNEEPNDNQENTDNIAATSTEEQENKATNQNIAATATPIVIDNPQKDEKTTLSEADNTNKTENSNATPSPESLAKVTIEAEKGLQSNRDIIFSITPPKALQDEATLNYHLSIAGKIYKQNTPTFTHQFDDAGRAIITGSVRIPGKKWFHSASQSITIEEYEAIKIKVPNVIGMKEVAARKALENKALKVGNIQQRRVDGKTGIIEQRPKAGTVLNEDNNTVHLVKAVGQKYKVELSTNKATVDEKQSINLTAKVNPRPASSKVEYRFVINGKTHRSDKSTMQHRFDKAGNYTASVKALVEGEGTFNSQIIDITVNMVWERPIARIEPAIISIEKGETATFNNASTSRHADANLQASWTDPTGKIHEGDTVSIDTQALQEGKHTLKVKVTDKEGKTAEASASILVRPSRNQIDTTAANEPEATGDDLKQILAKEATETEANILEKQKNDLAAAVDDAPVIEEVIEEETASNPMEAPQATEKQASETQTNEDNNSVQKSLNDNNNFSFWLWMSILGILFYAIFWFLRKLK